VAIQEARVMAALGSANGAILADLAGIQSFSALLLPAQLRVIFDPLNDHNSTHSYSNHLSHETIESPL
jgi:hypothetical protein